MKHFINVLLTRELYNIIFLILESTKNDTCHWILNNNKVIFYCMISKPFVAVKLQVKCQKNEHKYCR